MILDTDRNSKIMPNISLYYLICRLLFNFVKYSKISSIVVRYCLILSILYLVIISPKYFIGILLLFCLVPFLVLEVISYCFSRVLKANFMGV